jgi:hypothetical protein
MSILPPKVPVPGVIGILRTDKIRNLAFFDKQSNSKTIKFAKDNGLTIFDSSDGNFISFDYNINQEKEGSGKSIKMTVEVIDPTNTFESNLIAMSYRAAFGNNDELIKELDRLANLNLDNSTFNYEYTKKYPNGLTSKSKVLVNTEVKKELDELDLKIKKLDDSLEGLPIGGNQYRVPGFSLFTDKVFFTVDNSEQRTKIVNAIKGLNTQRDDLIKTCLDNQSKIKQDVENEILAQMKLLVQDVFPNIYFYFGLGPNYDSWSGPVNGTLTNLDYIYNGEGDIRKLVLEYMVTDAIFTQSREKVVHSGLDRIVSTDPIFLCSTLITHDDSHLNFIDFDPNYDTIKIQDQHIAFTACVENFLSKYFNFPKNNIICFLPNLNYCLKDYYETLVSSVNSYTLNSITDVNFGFDTSKATKKGMYAVIKLFEELGFNIVKTFTSEDRPIKDLNEWNLYKEKPPGKLNTEYPEYRNITSIFNINLTISQFEYLDTILEKLKSVLIKHSTVPFNSLDLYWEHDVEVIKIISRISGRPINTDKPLLIYGDIGFITNFLYGFYFGSDNLEVTDAVKQQIAVSDRFVLDSTYRKLMHNVLSIPTQKDNVFDALFYSLPDEYAFDNSGNKLPRVEAPIFKHGYPDSNILSLNVNYDSSYNVFLRQAMIPELNSTYNFTSTSSIGAIRKTSNDNKVDQSTVSGLVSYLKMTNGINLNKEDLIKYMSEGYSFLGMNALEFVSQIIIKNESEMNNSNRGIIYNEGLKNAAITKYCMLLNNLSKFPFTATIKTLPFFKLYKLAHLMSYPVYLFSREATLVGSNIGFINSLISGKWRILGFNHHIEQDQCYSTFTIYKLATDGVPEHIKAIQ